ncbi:hypothetical protein [Paenibacillus campi]|uniref:ImmA/IrrE family metallo-endopeptidase n=1 Tax=Paenibacillus campi TaxID=3106031 RepID=UPI002B002424|nr:hypothetical protein [Paenibacillus sp. SGZ-1009]
MPQITSDNLDETIQINEMIAKEVNAHVQFIEKRRIKWKFLPIEEQAYAILTEHHLIEVPIPDEDWGGAIRTFGNGKIMPIINTAQPRIYQYFIYWHEIFHLTENEAMNKYSTNYEISTKFDIRERKADYFASQMIFGDSDLYDYYFSLHDDDFIVKIAHCMKSFKAPYKAVLIQLYQIARQKDQPSLQSMIKSKFDYQPNFQQWCALFQQHALDDALIRPSLVLNLSPIKIAIQQEIDRHPDVELYRENLALIETWEKMYKEVQQREKERWNEELC